MKFGISLRPRNVSRRSSLKYEDGKWEKLLKKRPAIVTELLSAVKVRKVIRSEARAQSCLTRSAREH